MGKAKAIDRPALKARVRALQRALSSGLIEREVPARLVLLAALAGEHTLLIGPPGTAKSALARRLHLAFAGGAYFERLLTRFSVPEELFGPLSIAKLEQDRYERQTAGYLPEASVAFVDEIFKANSAILNALLTLLNEREFDNGSQRVATPLVSVVGASNELPAEEELAALYDRFLVRYHVEPVSDAGFDALIELEDDGLPAVDAALAFSPDELAGIRRAARGVALTPEVRAILKGLRRFLDDKRIPVSDRRWLKLVRLLQVAAYTDGRDEVSLWDTWLVQHVAWHRPEERERIAAEVEARLGAASPSEPDRFARVVAALEATLAQERDTFAQSRDAEGRLLYRGQDGDVTHDAARVPKRDAEGEALYLGPPNKPNRTNDGAGYTLKELRGFFRNRFGHTGLASFRLRLSESRDVTLQEYVEDANNWLYYEAPPVMEPMQFSRHHVEGRAAEVQRLEADLTPHVAGLAAEMARFESLITGHLWLPPAFIDTARRQLKANQERAAELHERLEALARGFELLPVRDG